ncbi:aromatic prenyltransferase [Byssothecium circinans]|uniref:Aromatic prenyltransferase n=1 Tax=Byssothecium circinans TaxID=147558 RepID=A0A6A5TIU8_9PLEO|nr:aromatic prenyltransferase [Byssothecium circinans]
MAAVVETSVLPPLNGALEVPKPIEVEQDIIVSDEDIAFWSNYCLPAFSALLVSTGSYTPEQQNSYITFFKDYIIPHIGPKPTAGADYLLAHTGSILETSINFSDARLPIIRFIFQPLLIGGIPKAIGADMTWYQEKKILDCLLGFDLHLDKRSMKAYFAPMYKHLLTGENTDQTIFALLKGLQPLGEGFVPALKKLEEFRAAEPQRNIDVVGIDCIKPEDGARVKLYTRLFPNLNAFATVEHHLTLGGRVTDETTLKGVELLRGIWHLLLDEPEGFTQGTTHKQETDAGSPHSGIMISWELQPFKESPSPKLYVPLWKFSNSNKSIAERYEKILDHFGAAIKQAFGDDGVSDGTPIVHTYCSFNLSKKKGKYMTSYTSAILAISS